MCPDRPFLCKEGISGSASVICFPGESGVGKSALIQHMIKELSKEGGTGTKADSLLGSVFNFADKHNELMENIMTLTKGNDGKLSSPWLVISAPMTVCFLLAFVLYTMNPCAGSWSLPLLNRKTLVELRSGTKVGLPSYRHHRLFAPKSLCAESVCFSPLSLELPCLSQSGSSGLRFKIHYFTR